MKFQINNPSAYEILVPGTSETVAPNTIRVIEIKEEPKIPGKVKRSWDNRNITMHRVDDDTPLIPFHQAGELRPKPVEPKNMTMSELKVAAQRLSIVFGSAIGEPTLRSRMLERLLELADERGLEHAGEESRVEDLFEAVAAGGLPERTVTKSGEPIKKPEPEPVPAPDPASEQEDTDDGSTDDDTATGGEGDDTLPDDPATDDDASEDETASE